ncbi:hypothetical protein H0H87_003993 [Tephrocybe sp. NHM501043]|nr:hypothetical protein H0H87_003993 [Tephrocybe sp. NHM501043]
MLSTLKDLLLLLASYVPPLAGFLNSLLCIADHSLTQFNHAFKSWCVLGDSISKILKDWEAAWEKERLKEKELEHCAAQTSKEKLSGSQELLLDIECFLEGQGLLKELDVEKLFAALDQAYLLETLCLDIAFQTTQFMDCNIAQTGTQLSALHFVNSDTSKSSETAADDSDVDTPEAIPKNDDVSSAITATLQLN